MADILIQCIECSREYHVSEYASGTDLTCGTCGAELILPGRESNTGGLKLRPNSETQSFAFHPPTHGIPAPADGPATRSASYAGTEIIHDHEVVLNHPRHWVSWIIAAITIAAFVGFQYRAGDLSQYMDHYLWSRNVFALFTYLMVVVVAFQDNLGPGALCLLVPPYMLYYTLSSIESSVLRGLFHGALVVLVVEMILIPEHSVIIGVGDALGGVIQDVDGLIKSASDKPILN